MACPALRWAQRQLASLGLQQASLGLQQAGCGVCDIDVPRGVPLRAGEGGRGSGGLDGGFGGRVSNRRDRKAARGSEGWQALQEQGWQRRCIGAAGAQNITWISNSTVQQMAGQSVGMEVTDPGRGLLAVVASGIEEEVTVVSASAAALNL